MKRRTMMFPAVLAGAALVLAACSGQTGSEDDVDEGGADTGGEQIEIKVAVWSNWDFVQRAGELYTEDHPNVTVTVDAISGDDYFAALPRTLGTSGAPDITVLQVIGTGSYQDLVDQGSLVDISDIWEQESLQDVTDPTIVDVYTQEDGSRYAVNVGPTFLPVTYYNKDLLAEAGVEVEEGGQIESLEEMYAISDQLTAAGVTPMVYPWNGDAHHLFQQQLLSACGDETYQGLGTAWRDEEGSAEAWDQECVVRAIDSMKQMQEEGVFGSDPVIDRDVAAAAFLSGNAGMMTTGMWSVSQFRDQADFDFGWFMTPPAIDGEQSKWVLWTADGLGVNAASDNVDVAKDFLATIMTQEFQSSMLSDGRPPSRTDVVVPDDADQMLVAMQNSFDTYGTGLHIIQGLTPPDYMTVISDGMQEVMIGATDSAGLASRLQALTEQLRADNA